MDERKTKMPNKDEEKGIAKPDKRRQKKKSDKEHHELEFVEIGPPSNFWKRPEDEVFKELEEMEQEIFGADTRKGGKVNITKKLKSFKVSGVRAKSKQLQPTVLNTKEQETRVELDAKSPTRGETFSHLFSL